MSQNASLYRVDQAGLSYIADNLENFGIEQVEKGHETFQQSFEALHFLLAKNQEQDATDLITQIFYPGKYLGEEPDFENFDFENAPEDFDFGNDPVVYHDPEKTELIANFLDGISIDHFRTLFDADELNENGIYPQGAWNNDTSEDTVFNTAHLTEDLVKLKRLFEEAKKEKDYILVFIG
jgi:hypothetical protein